MDIMDIKMKCAKAALKYIGNGTVIGLGGGSTIAHLIRFIQEEQLDIKVVTPSWETKRKCEGVGLAVIPLSEASAVDVAFDGCDQVDAHLHALKSGGGIHTDEKLVASMANEYILLVDESKVVKELTYEHPVVLEVIPQALAFVMHQLSDAEKVEIRMSSDKDGPVMTDRGNLLLDVYVKGSQDSVRLEERLKGLAGVLDVSLFTSVVTKAVVASESGIREMTKHGV
ncbi:ribose-5-phosphate isomerase [Rossellomorea marisflavi]|uniref:Ribose 5-phosphate isomerase A n=3 Tax=Bacillaceae TaxID=186817 RepID=A0A161T5W9_9BACI|nr:ribose 5-phosphate isomerase [Rossellomorea marisflavi]KZE48523.1 ribose-5-phosphate isomerase [Rossellomorea marisflavi]GLI85353.1 ribose-5-phosphate isomerase [Rossellomorea marisflavi]